ncbi:hypothetical protein DL765_002731 [Monosporascus sp. GIB2]|nr:hypothetical protein DL765_002731 [Monosporascus sp. GIB2]
MTRRTGLSKANCIFVVVDLDSYDVSHYPEYGGRQSKMMETITQFEVTVDLESLRGVPVILALDRLQRLREKMRGTPIRECFPDYTGGDER